MLRYGALLIAICFLFEPTYFILRGVINPQMPRMDGQPEVFAVLLAFSSLFPFVAYIFFNKLHKAFIYSLCIAATIYASFAIWTIFYGSKDNGIYDDFFLSLVLVVKGISIGGFLLRKDFANTLLKNMSVISILLSILYIFVFINQISAQLFYPGVGGATYQKASYMLALLIILNFLAFYYLDLIQKSTTKFFIFLINIILIFGMIYNGGRGAVLAILILSLYLFRHELIIFFKNIRRLKIDKLHLLVLGFLISFGSLASIFISPDIINSLTKGLVRIFEILIVFASNNEFDGSSVGGRNLIYSRAINGILAEPITGYGPLWAAKEVVPAHNIFLGILLQYGMIIGSFLIAIMLSLFIRGFQYKDLHIFYLIFTPTIVNLLFSGNYLLSFEFWVFLTLLLSIGKLKYEKK